MRGASFEKFDSYLVPHEQIAHAIQGSRPSGSDDTGRGLLFDQCWTAYNAVLGETVAKVDGYINRTAALAEKGAPLLDALSRSSRALAELASACKRDVAARRPAIRP